MLFTLLLPVVVFAQDPATTQDRILAAYFDIFAEQWIPPLSHQAKKAGAMSWTQEDTNKHFPSVARANPKTAEDWQKLALTDKRTMLTAYYAIIGPDASPDVALLRPLADFVVGPGGNADTLAQAIEKATSRQVIGILPGVHVGDVVLTNDLVLIGLGRSSEVVVQGRVKAPVAVTGGDILLCGLTFRFQSQNDAKMYALDVAGGSATVVSCRAHNDSLAGFVVREEASAKFVRCIAEKNTHSGFSSLGRSRMEATHCRSLGNGHCGFLTQGDAGGSFTCCIAENNKESGFAGIGRSRMEATHCRSIENGHSGFLTQNDAGGSFTRCIAEKNTHSGFAGIGRSRMEATHCRSLGNSRISSGAWDSSSVKLIFFETLGNKGGDTPVQQSAARLSHEYFLTRTIKK